MHFGFEFISPNLADDHEGRVYFEFHTLFLDMPSAMTRWRTAGTAPVLGWLPPTRTASTWSFWIARSSEASCVPSRVTVWVLYIRVRVSAAPPAVVGVKCAHKSALYGSAKVPCAAVSNRANRFCSAVS